MDTERTGNAWTGTTQSLRDYKNIPATTLHDLIRYCVEGRGGGHFINALLTNDLQGAFKHADNSNIRALWAITTWLFNRAPRECQGSKVVVDEWRMRGGLRAHYAGHRAAIQEWVDQATAGTLLEGMVWP